VRQHSEGNHDDAHTNKTEEDENVKNKPLMNYIVEDGKSKDEDGNMEGWIGRTKGRKEKENILPSFLDFMLRTFCL
jgi:hypothetical protein